MVFNIYGTWCWVTFEKLMMKIYDFFYSAKHSIHPSDGGDSLWAKSFSLPVAYNNV